MTKEEMLALLHQDIVPAAGCTEPVCVALAAADAAKAVGGAVREIRVEVSRNIYKNGVSAGIAGFDQVGLEYAAALGAFIGEPGKGLALMQSITEDIARRAKALAESGRVAVAVCENENGIYVRCKVTTSTGEGVSVIRGAHTNIILTQANGQALRQGESTSAASGMDLLEKLKAMPIAEIRALAASATEDELAFLMDGVAMNERLADYATRQNPGIGIAGALQGNEYGLLSSDGVMDRIMVRVASAAEARLEGCPYAAMSSAGSGSKGIAVILPIIEVARAIHAGRLKTLQALAFGHLINEYMNAHIGKLTAICACATASATGASAAITWLLGGADEEIGYAIRNMTGSITGMICDGGKAGCALKLSTALGAALMSAQLAACHVGLRPTDGVCAETPEACVRNISRISSPGMVETDEEILHILLEKLQ